MDQGVTEYDQAPGSYLSSRISKSDISRSPWSSRCQ